MADPIKFTLTHNATEVVGRLEAFPPKMMRGIAKSLDQENQRSVEHIIEHRLTGPGPFPVEEHRLGNVTSRLRRSPRITPATITGETIDSAIGTNVAYAGAHEFGFQGTVTVREHRAANQQVDLIQVGERVLPRWLSVGERGRKKKIASGIVTVRQHTREMNIPARAPLRTGIRDRLDNYSTAISEAIVLAWGGNS